jgi:hypothetical protein
MQQRGFGRRDFLRTSGIIVTTFAAGGSIIFGPNHAWAQAATSLDPHSTRTLLMMTYDLFPHEMLGVEYYAKVVDELDKTASANPAKRRLLLDGVAQLDGTYGVKWVDLSDGAREAALRKIEKTEFFGTVRDQTITGLYGNPLVYRMFNYGGPSAEYGGYIERGFDDIGWLPQA